MAEHTLTVAELQLFAALLRFKLEPADAIVLLTGDGLNRVAGAAELFHRGLAPMILVSGGALDPDYGSIPGPNLVPELARAGVPASALRVEAASQNTREQAVAVLATARREGWARILLVASPYHGYRAFLTFLQVLDETGGDDVQILPAPVDDLPWFQPTGWGRRINLLVQELERTERYRGLGHCATTARGLAYLEALESRLASPQAPSTDR